ncbi:MAG: hypothetical protein HY553_10920 [Elusimicrobia bacterium]|nr:hypothetical protein [Elusimicrobiota bacterium]
MTRAALLGLVVALLSSGCALRRNWNFTREYLSGPAAKTACFEGKDGLRGCRFAPKSGPVDESTLLVFLHYATGDEKSFGTIGLARSFFARYRKAGKPAPRVLSLSYGPHWVLSKEPGKRQVVNLEAFTRTVDELESGASRKFAWGMSMGGYNSAVLALQAPGWAGAALSCPALFEGDPFDDSIAPALMKLPGANAREVQDGRALFTTRLAGAETWRRENPLALAASGKAAPMLIEPNAEDEFGFLPGARALAKALAAAGRPPVYRERPGGHCVIGAATVADFMMGL